MKPPHNFTANRLPAPRYLLEESLLGVWEGEDGAVTVCGGWEQGEAVGKLMWWDAIGATWLWS